MDYIQEKLLVSRFNINLKGSDNIMRKDGLILDEVKDFDFD